MTLPRSLQKVDLLVASSQRDRLGRRHRRPPKGRGQGLGRCQFPGMAAVDGNGKLQLDERLYSSLLIAGNVLETYKRVARSTWIEVQVFLSVRGTGFS
jgi:hypothetical protein